jgi:hypothetical protein
MSDLLRAGRLKTVPSACIEKEGTGTRILQYFSDVILDPVCKAGNNYGRSEYFKIHPRFETCDQEIILNVTKFRARIPTTSG